MRDATPSTDLRLLILAYLEHRQALVKIENRLNF